MARETQIRITVDSAQANRELNKLDRNLKGTSAQGKKTGRDLVALGKRFAGMATAVIGVTAAFSAFIKSQIAVADQIGKTADKIGVGVEMLQELRFAADLAGVSQTALDMGLQRFARRSAEAARGSGVLAKEFERLGIETHNVDGGMRSVEEVLYDYADAIADAESSSEQLRLAFKAFDSEGAALVNLFREGAIGVEELRQQLRDMGGVMSEESVRAAEELQNQITILGARFDAFKFRVFEAGLELLEFFRIADRADRFSFKTFEEAADRIRTSAEEVARLQQEIADIEAIERNRDWWRFLTEEQKELIATLPRLRSELEEAERNLEAQTRAAQGLAPAIQEVTGAMEDQLELITTTATAHTDLEEAMRAVFAQELAQAKRQEQLNLLYEHGAISLEVYIEKMKELKGINIDESLQRARDAIAEMDEEMAKLTDTTDGWAEAFDKALADEVVSSIGDMSDAFVDWAITGEQSFADMTQSILENITKMIVQMQILQSLGVTPGGGITSGSFLGNFFGAKNGAAFKKGVQMFANGGVVNSATGFAHGSGLGVMGEKGPEAILPLQRSGNVLGVQGAAPQVTVINQAQSAEADVAVSQDGMNIEIIVADIVKKQMGSGAFDKQMSSNFGLSRRGR